MGTSLYDRLDTQTQTHTTCRYGCRRNGITIQYCMSWPRHRCKVSNSSSDSSKAGGLPSRKRTMEYRTLFHVCSCDWCETHKGQFWSTRAERGRYGNDGDEKSFAESRVHLLRDLSHLQMISVDLMWISSCVHADRTENFFNPIDLLF